MKTLYGNSGSRLRSYHKALSMHAQLRKYISVEMKLVIILCGISLVLGYEESYEGFNECGMDGWECESERGKYEITYTCPSHHPSARVWVWTARLPTGTSTFTVRNCHHLEVHFDCTLGLRSTLLRQFKVINITNLEILPPQKPGVFLHDNDQVPHSPPIFHLKDVKKIKWYPGVFDKPGGSCRYKFVELTTLTLENVHIDRIMKDLFHNQLMNTLVMKNVVIDAIDGNAMIVSADTTITGTTFPIIPSSAISFRGESISFINNTFKKIDTNGIIIKSKEFKFYNNKVDEINSQGLDVLGSRIEIGKNIFQHLETGALQRITPGYSPLTYEIASKFIYNFSDNIIKNMSPGSIHINWEIYKKVCSDIIFKNNLFDCSCTNLGWVSVSNGLGPKISKVKEFYDVYFNKDDNACIGHEHCPLNAVTAQMQDVCNHKTNVSTICTSLGSVTEVVTTTVSDDVTMAMSNTAQKATTEETFLTDRIEVTEKVIPVLSYTENQTSRMETTGLPIWFIVIPVIIILAAICLGIFMWWYKKKKQRQMIMTMYKNERGIDADNLIVINEHHNELYDKQ